MFTVTASTLTEYFSFDPAREPELRAVDKTLHAAAPGLKRYLFQGTGSGKAGMSMSMIGYGQFQYYVQSSDEPINWPIIGMALQKNYISLYIAAVVDDHYLVEEYPDRLGKAKVGQNMARFRTANELNMDGLTDLATRIDNGVRDGTMQFRYGRAKNN